MYSFLEIQFIFMNCSTLDDILDVMYSFLYVKADDDLTDDQSNYIRDLSKERMLYLIS